MKKGKRQPLIIVAIIAVVVALLGANQLLSTIITPSTSELTSGETAIVRLTLRQEITRAWFEFGEYTGAMPSPGILQSQDLVKVGDSGQRSGDGTPLYHWEAEWTVPTVASEINYILIYYYAIGTNAPTREISIIRIVPSPLPVSPGYESPPSTEPLPVIGPPPSDSGTGGDAGGEPPPEMEVDALALAGVGVLIAVIVVFVVLIAKARARSR